MSGFAARAALVQERIREACARCGREASSVELLPVSKFHPAAAVQEALACGLVDFVVPDDQLEETALNLAKKLAAGPTAAYAADKRLFRIAANIPYEQLLVAESDEISFNASLKDSHEGVSAMLEKRKPAFKGDYERA